MRRVKIGFLIVILMALIMGLGLFRAGVSFSTESLELWVDDDPGCEEHSPCYNSIQAAIDAVPKDGKALVHILPGTYEENLVIQSREITLRGSGAEATILSAPDPTRPTILISDLRELDFGFQQAIVSDLKISGGSVGVQIEHTAAAWVEENQIIITTGEAGVRVTDSTRIQIENNEIRSWGTSRIWGLPVAIDLGENLGEVEVADNYIHGPGIDVTSGERITIIGNHIEGNRGVWVKEAHRIFIAYNYIVAEAGILIWNPEYAEVVWNTIQTFGSPSLGIGVDPQQGIGGGVIKPLIAHNLITNGGVGIGVGLTVFSDEKPKPESCPIIEYNTVQNVEVGIGIYAPFSGRLVRPIIRYNLLQGNGRGLMAPSYVVPAGITCSHGGGSQLAVEGNTFINNMIGIELGSGVKADLTGNYIARNSTGVIPKDGEFGFNKNTIIYNRNYGIAISASGYCMVEGAYGEGVPEAIEGQDNEIHDNGNDLCPQDYPWPEGFVKGSE